MEVERKRHSWWLLTDTQGALRLVYEAAVAAGFRVVPAEPDGLTIDIPGSLWSRRRPARLTASMSAGGPVVGCVGVNWKFDGPSGPDCRYFLLLERRIEARNFYYSGLLEAAEKAGVTLGGREDIRALVDVLNPGESVNAVGRGLFREKPGLVMITDHRFLCVGGTGWEKELALNLPLGCLKSVALGKKTSGETLTMTVGAEVHLISSLGHGEGHGLVGAFRKMTA